MPFRFVHTADIHLDSPLRSLAMRDPELAALIGGATRQALVGIVDLCIEERVDALVIAGDLYDGDQTSMKTARFLADQMRRLHEAGVVVYKVRGNHDALSRITQELVLPPSLKLFGGRAETVELRLGGLDVAIHGLSFAKPHAPESLLPKYGRPRPGAFNLGIMHTSLAGASGHDPYAPCAVADLDQWGFDYWALGHIHVRSEHRGASTVVMPGMPQGRDIGEAGPKTVSLVTVSDDHRMVIEERPTSVAQFERIPVDLTDAATWSEIIDRIERDIAAVRDATPAAPHLVGRLVLGGRTEMAWRMRRDRDLLQTDVEHRLGSSGGTWIDKIEIGTEPARGATPAGGTADPVDELSTLIRDEILSRHEVRESVAALVKEIRDDLPPEARRFCGDDEAVFERFVDRLLGDSGEEIVARLAQDGAELR
ncbi:MAG: DNA repair exonuclease [Rhizobiales bacterium]|nr:DNA repair exonuclease [Hyphomicrobiales bacterium]